MYVITDAFKSTFTLVMLFGAFGLALCGLWGPVAQWICGIISWYVIYRVGKALFSWCFPE